MDTLKKKARRRLNLDEIKSKMNSNINREGQARDGVIPVADITDGHSLTEETVRKIPVRDIEPSKCSPWRFHNRDSRWLNEKLCQDLIGSIRRNGQQEPGLVRKNENGNGYEIIFGVRRWFSCKHLGRPFRARVVNKTDRECMVLMHIENADSKDISDFERAVSFKLQYDSGEFHSKKDMSESLGIPGATLTRMLMAAEIWEDPFLKEVLSNPIQIPLTRAYKLSQMLKNVHSKKILQKEAERIVNLKSPISTQQSILLLERSMQSDKEGELNSTLANLIKIEGVSAKVNSRGVLNISVSKNSKNKTSIKEKISELLEEFL